MIKPFIYFVLVCCLISSCAVITPLSPEIVSIDVPPKIQSESSVYIPIKIKLQSYLNEVDKSLPMNFSGKVEECEGVSYSYQFEREKINFKGKGSSLYYEIKGQYGINLQYCPKCASVFSNQKKCLVPRIYADCGINEPKRRIEIGYSSTFELNPDLQIKSNTTLQKFEMLDPCEITVFKYDATSKIQKEVKTALKNLEKDIDLKIGAIDLRSNISKTWNQLAQPIAIGRYGFLNIHPKAISLSDFRFTNQDAFVDLNLIIQPTITDSPAKPQNHELPSLSKHSKSKGFDIQLDIITSYDSLNSLFSKEIKGKELMIKKNKIIFKSVVIQGSVGKRMTLKVDFDGKRSGTLYLIGTPVFDPYLQEISFPDLTFDLKTRNTLLKSAKWLFNNKITSLMREKTTFELKDQLMEVQKTLQKEMNREISKGIRLSGKVQNVAIEEIYPGSKELIVRVNSRGELLLILE